MYRLIVPVVDFANSEMGLTAYFEFNQTSDHKTSQSVDIALLDGAEPKVMIEAKRVDRGISAEQISKYLRPGVRGLVTNGVHWVMCLDGGIKAVSLRDASDGKANLESLGEIVAFIRGEEHERTDWSENAAYVKPIVKPVRPHKPDRAIRKSNPIEVATDASAFRTLLAQLPSASRLDMTFLDSMASQFETQSGLPSHLRAEVRSSRVSFFDSRIASRSTRVARIELGKNQPDILVLTTLASASKDLARIATPTPHDKGPHMRRFRLFDEVQARSFGVELAKVLTA